VPRTRKSWRQKLDAAKAKPDLPRIFTCYKTGKVFVVPSPAEIEPIIRAVPRGEVITMQQISRRLADAHKADLACPITTGLFCRLIAEAAEETGEPDGLPWWRVLKTGNELNMKYPGGGGLQRRRLEDEGHRVKAMGKKLVVSD